MPPFEPVERLPVAEDVHAAFKKLRSAEMGSNLSGYSARERIVTARSRAALRLSQATEEASRHFGGDAGEMMKHFKRWVRWGGSAMSLADMIPMPRETFEEGMKNASDIMAGGKQKAERLRVTRTNRGV